MDGLVREQTTRDRTDLITVMTPDERMELLAFMAGYRPEWFDETIAAKSGGTFAGELSARVAALDVDK